MQTPDNNSAAKCQTHNDCPTLCETTTATWQWAAAVARAQATLGALYGRVHDAIRARGVPPPDEVRPDLLG